MSAAHHSDEDRKQQEAIFRRLFEQKSGTAKRSYPEGRMGPTDEGELAFAVGIDDRYGTVVVNFNKPVSWMGMSPEDAVKLAQMLIAKARLASKKPLIVELG